MHRRVLAQVTRWQLPAAVTVKQHPHPIASLHANADFAVVQVLGVVVFCDHDRAARIPVAPPPQTAEPLVQGTLDLAAPARHVLRAGAAGA